MRASDEITAPSKCDVNNTIISMFKVTSGLNTPFFLQRYFVLLILTDGIISDMAQTKEAIVNVSIAIPF